MRDKMSRFRENIDFSALQRSILQNALRSISDHFQHSFHTFGQFTSSALTWIGVGGRRGGGGINRTGSAIPAQDYRYRFVTAGVLEVLSA